MKQFLWVLLLIMTLAFFFSIYWCVRLYTVANNGIIVSGLITNIREANCNDFLCHFYTIEFTEKGGRKIEISLDLSKDYAKVGDSIRLMYDINNPQGAEIYNNRVHCWNCMGGIAFLLFIIFAVIWSLSNFDMIAEFLNRHNI